MAGLFVGLIVVVGMGVAVAASLAAYAQRHWMTGRTPVVAAGTPGPARRSYFVRPLGDVAGFGEQLRDAPLRYGYLEGRRAG